MMVVCCNTQNPTVPPHNVHPLLACSKACISEVETLLQFEPLAHAAPTASPSTAAAPTEYAPQYPCSITCTATSQAGPSVGATACAES
jgi:hypothetical protein